MRGWIRSSLFVSGATVLHAAVLIAAAVCPHRPEAARVFHLEGLDPSIDIVSHEPLTPDDQSASSASGHLAAVHRDIRSGVSAARERVPSYGSESEQEGLGTAEQGPSELSSEGTWSLSPSRRGAAAARPASTADIGVGPSLSWRLAPQLADRKDPAVRQAEESAGGLRDALDAHDHEIGLGRGGAIVSALETAAGIEPAPVSGKASFEVTVSSSGNVWVGVSRVDGAWPAWNKVAAKLAADLKSKTFRVPPGARGLRFQIDLDARVVEYDGSKAPTGTRVEASPGKIGDHGMYEKLPGVYLSGGGRICQYQLGLVPVPQQPIGIAGWCDPTKLVVKPQRVVSARVVSEGRL